MGLILSTLQTTVYGKTFEVETFAIKDSCNYFPVNTIVSSTVVLTAYYMKENWCKTCKNQVDVREENGCSWGNLHGSMLVYSYSQSTRP